MDLKGKEYHPDC